MGSDDTALLYTDDAYSSYQNIFDNTKTDITDSDKDRLIASLKQLNAQENLEEVVDVEEVIRYFVVHNFVCNFDSYTGSMIHNYYLYEEDGQLSMIPWDYNLAFGGFLGSSDATALVNYPIDTPVSGGTVDSRPMLAWIFSSEEYTQLYHQYFSQFLAEWFDSGAFAQAFQQVVDLITPPMWRKTPPSSAPQRNSRRGWRPWRTSACCEPKASKASWRAPSPPRTTGRARTAPAWWTPPRWTSPPWAP